MSSSPLGVIQKPVQFGWPSGKRAGTIIAQGTPDEIRNHPDPEVQQFIKGEPDGPVPLKLSPEDYIDRLLGHPRQKGVDY